MRHATLSGYWVLIQVSLGYSHLRDRFLTCYAPVRHSPIGTEVPGSFDLHVLSTPPAFVLSQDQTLPQDLTTSTQRYLRHDRRAPAAPCTGWKYPRKQQLAGIVAELSSGEPSDNAAIIWLCRDHEWSDTIFCVKTTSGPTRLCGSVSGYVSNSRPPALAFIVLCSVVKERCGHL